MCVKLKGKGVTRRPSGKCGYTGMLRSGKWLMVIRFFFKKRKY